jgi:hypothetical protein
MSAIAFPGHPSSSSQHDDSLYPLTLPFDSAPGFQMNPLSAHPPRTPRSSVIASNPMPFSLSVNTSKEEPEDHPTNVEVELNVDEEECQEKSAQKTQIHAQDIWREFLKTSSGRDKAFVLILLLQPLLLLIVFGIGNIQKIIQYSMNVYLVFHRAVSRHVPLQGARKRAFEVELLQRLGSTVSRLSLTRCGPVTASSD